MPYKARSRMWRGLQGCYRLFSTKIYINKSEVMLRNIKGAEADLARMGWEVEAELAIGIDVEKAGRR